MTRAETTAALVGDAEDMADRDEVERRLLARLMPEGMEWLVEAWPRFEDGRPVRFSDDFERYGDENGVSVVTMYSDGSFALNFRAYSKGERVKRPAKVPDADGVEIRVGDTVWGTNGHGPFEVTRIVYADRLRVICDDEKNGHLNAYPDMLTHRAPVPAADGRPLREGETVWDENGDELVIGALEDGGHTVTCRYVDVGDAIPVHGMWSPSQLTHERPVADTWERLEEDANKGSCDYFGCDANGCHGCPAYGWNVARGGSGCGNAKMRDIVRRARALAERGR